MMARAPVRSTGPGRAPLVVKSVGRRLWWFVVSEEKPDGYFDVAQLHEAAGGLLFINLVHDIDNRCFDVE